MLRLPEPFIDAEIAYRRDQAIASLDQMCQLQGLVTYAGKSIQDYTVGGVNPISEPAWQSVLDANNLGGSAPRVPLLQYHGLLDEVIPWSVEATLHGQYCAMGVTTQLSGYPGDHVLTQVLAQSDVVNWIAARFARQIFEIFERPRERAPVALVRADLVGGLDLRRGVGATHAGRRFRVQDIALESCDRLSASTVVGEHIGSGSGEAEVAVGEIRVRGRAPRLG